MQNTTSDWKLVIQYGLLGGTISLLLSLVGMVIAFSDNFIISGVMSMGQIMLIAPILLLSYTAVNKASEQTTWMRIILGLVSGLLGGLVLVALVGLGQLINLRAMFINASPDLYALLTLDQENLFKGLLLLALIATVVGGIGAGFVLLSSRIRRAISQAILWLVVIGLMRDLLVTMIGRWGPVSLIFRWMFALSGLVPLGAAFIFLLVGGIIYWKAGQKPSKKTSREPLGRQQKIARWGLYAVLGVITLLLPTILGSFFSEILDNVGIYILMGLGLNIVVGFAGLLDLGYVAFYAIGAYTVGVLTSPELGFFHLTFWQALPIALVMAVFAGIILGTPVLKMRGDYLAIVTLGFGEIIRILVLSDWLRPYLGGTQGIQQIARPYIGSIELANQGQLYYLILAGIIVAGFVAWRIKDSRVGRAWMALREDEDVAQAMGINLVSTKLMAFGMGALFSGLGGAIFAAKLTSAYPQSFNLYVSINVLSLIIIGGMGSIPGVFVGALALMGLPELLREFAEFRFLVYGAALVTMMLVRPEGLWPEARRQLELHDEELLASETPEPVSDIPGQ
jgi:branched-chain amino acid transport system permease protein